MGMKGKVALGAVVGIVVIGVASATSGGDGDGGSGGGGKGSSASAGQKAGGGSSADTAGGGTDGSEVADKVVEIAGDGDFQVGGDVRPGTYRTSGNTDDMCYWERAKDASGEIDSLLANDNVSGTSYVTILATDKLFKSSGCKDWEAVDPKAKGTKGTPAAKMAGNGGMFGVGADIAPGTYRSTGNTDDLCYWERSKDASHSVDSIVANNNVNGTAVVTISASDGYFKTTGCQDWVKTG